MVKEGRIAKLSKYFEILFRDITTFGGALFYGLVSLLVLILGEMDLFWKLVIGFLSTFIVTMIIRSFYFRNRPKRQQFHNFAEKLDASSFPSLHASRTLFLSLSLIFFFENIYTTILFIALFLAVAYSRIFLKKHDYWDLIGGTILGIIVFGISLII